MKKSHWVVAVVVLLVGYALGVFYPQAGEKLKAKVALGA